MIRVVVSGICGHMGATVARFVAAEKDMVLSGGVEDPHHADIGRRLCDAWGDGNIELRVAPDLTEIGSEYDVLVDFSSPGQAVECARVAGDSGRGLVVGTTGLNGEQLEVVRRASSSCALVIAPNTSLGVNVLFQLVRNAAGALGGDFDVEIVEAHHRRKKDAPSGTAVRLAEIVREDSGAGMSGALRCGRSGPTGPRPAGEVCVHSIRGGEIVGRHDVMFISEFEELTLSHGAISRDSFARGAVRAARFVAHAEPGLYGMSDVLGLSDRRNEH